MTQKSETRRAWRERAPNSSLGGDASEYTRNRILFNQAAVIARRFAVSDALARLIAEHAYAAGPAQ